MKLNDKIKLLTEKDRYSWYGVHAVMVGFICDSRKVNDGKDWLVTFEKTTNGDISCISVNEYDLEIIEANRGDEPMRMLYLKTTDSTKEKIPMLFGIC